MLVNRTRRERLYRVIRQERSSTLLSYSNLRAEVGRKCLRLAVSDVLLTA